jgi:hypothetical protein
MESFDDQLRERLERIEASAQVPDRPGKAPRPRRAGRPIAVAAGLVLAGLLAGGVGAAALEAVRGYPGVFSSGGALACSNIQKMSPPRADELLTQLGYEVTWQIENRDTSASSTSTEAPVVGYIQEGVLHGQKLLIVVETGSKAVPVGSSDC